ncbi:MAG TPA: hypothetical protein PK876_05255 [Elusimicrobiota bacterium]|nr:hypothetical protein [Elusimicrobiota bacterium]
MRRASNIILSSDDRPAPAGPRVCSRRSPFPETPFFRQIIALILTHLLFFGSFGVIRADEASPATTSSIDIKNQTQNASSQVNLSFDKHSIEEDLGLQEPPPPSTEVPDPANLFHFDQSRWNAARDAIEKGLKPGEEEAPSVFVSTEAIPPPEEEAGFEVELPYESGLVISGRKLIALKLKETRYLSAKKPKELGVKRVQRDLEMQQELQVRIKGKVGRKITVNVDFDDTKEDKRDISVSYQGDPDEIVQEAAFGDITLSLPSTEFVSYNKQLFGIRTKLKYKRAQFMAIGSRTKGVTETKRFAGTVQFEKKEIADTSYIRRRYYQLAFNTAHLPLVTGSEEIWMDDRVGTNNTANTSTMTAVDYALNTTQYTGPFDKLVPGQDYTIDYARGLLTFRSERAVNAVIAVNYTAADGTSLASLGSGSGYKILKTENDLPIIGTGEAGYDRELKTYYSIGRIKIVRDNGRGNFIFATQDLNRNALDVPTTDGKILGYPTNIDVDFETGIFNIASPVKVADATLYSPTPTHKFSYYLEYLYRVKTYLIKPNIVLGSEKVLIDGRLLTRDLDYFIDYDSGYLTFFQEDLITEYSNIEVIYEVAPFGGQLGQTLVGSRTELALVPDRFNVGSTVLYSFSPKPTTLPDIRSTPNSLLLVEADSQIKDMKIPLIPWTMSISGEVAQSRENPNLFGKALVDSMEGIKQEDMTVMDIDFWQYASNPTGGGTTHPSAMALSDEDVKVNTINPFSNTKDSETQRVMNVDFSMAASEQDSLVQGISNAGRDFSKKLYLELLVEGAGTNGSGMDLIVDAGQFNEDADGDGSLDTEDKNQDGTLNQGEDDGWNYDDPGPDNLHNGVDDKSVKIGPNNGRIDAEDLDSDGTKDFIDVTPRAAPLFKLSNGATAANGIKIINPQTRAEENQTDLGFTGWRFIQIPLKIASTEESAFQAIKQVRLTLRAPTANSSAGRVRIGKISFTGNRWESPVTVGGSTMTISAVNNFDNPNYVSLIANPVYDGLYEQDSSQRSREQALALDFQLPAGGMATTRSVYPTPRDFSKHRAFHFMVSPSEKGPPGATLVVQLGSETDYFEYTIPLTFSNWQLLGANLVDVNDDDVPDTWVPLEANASVRVQGSPSFSSIGQIKVGVRNDSGAPINGGVWINELHVTGARKKVGQAERLSADISWPGWATFGGKYRKVDRRFQTITSLVTNQDKIDQSGYLNFNRISFMPMSFTASQSETITPAAIQTGPSGLISVLEEGKVTNTSGSGKADLIIPYLPKLGMGYDRSLSKSNILQRTDDKESYTGSTDYTLPFKLDILPTRFLTFRPLPEYFSGTYRRTNYFLIYDADKKLTELAVSTNTANQNKSIIFNNARTIEITDDWSGRMGFTPWNGLSMTPSYSIKKVREERRFTEDDLESFPELRPSKKYPKSMSQTMGLSASWRILRWLEPRGSYSMTGTETNGLPTISTPTAYDIKTLDRSGTAEGAWTFNVRELLTRFRPTRSLSIYTSYNIQTGDAYENLERNFKWRKNYWINKKPLEPENEAARRKQFTQRQTRSLSGNWNPLDWIPFPFRLSPLRTFSTTAKYSNTDEHKETTETPTDSKSVTWPDLTLSLRDTEKFFWLERWMGNSQANVRTSRRFSETVKVNYTENRDFSSDYRFTLWKRFDLFFTYTRNSSLDLNTQTMILNSIGRDLSYSSQIGMAFGSWRFTPRYDYVNGLTRDGSEKTTRDLTTKNYSLQIYLDKAYPSGFRLPFTRIKFEKVSRFILNTTLRFEKKRSTLNVERDNTNTYAVDIRSEYEIAKNFRLTIGAGGSRIKNKIKKDESIQTYELNSSLVIQF